MRYNTSLKYPGYDHLSERATTDFHLSDFIKLPRLATTKPTDALEFWTKADALLAPCVIYGVSKYLSYLLAIHWLHGFHIFLPLRGMLKTAVRYIQVEPATNLSSLSQSFAHSFPYCFTSSMSLNGRNTARSA
jgi:hypothetical protein